jgi:hypothetical protein
MVVQKAPIFVRCSSPLSSSVKISDHQGTIHFSEAFTEEKKIKVSTSDMPIGNYLVSFLSEDQVIDTAILSVVDEASERRADWFKRALHLENLALEYALDGKIFSAFVRLEKACRHYLNAEYLSSAA